MLTETGEKIFKLKYAKDEEETWADACLRVALYVASVEDEDAQAEWTAKFFQLIHELAFLPAGRILANAGTEIKNLMNCFVLPMEDSRKEIYKTLGNAAEIFTYGGGIGYNFSHLREEGALINTTGTPSSGPVSFMELFNSTAEIIQQASRRGAQMGMLNVRHPDILKFINYKSSLNRKHTKIINEIKRKLGVRKANFLVTSLGYGENEEQELVKKLSKVLADNQLNYFNISVVLPDDFMRAVEEDKDWNLISPLTNKIVQTVKAKELFSSLAESAWESGDPGVYFIDRANEDNIVKYLGRLETTNPCGEVPLLPYEPCCLGSLNLHKFYNPISNGVDLEFLEFAIRTAVRFLDNVQEISYIPIPEVEDMAKGLRRIGLGVMGWADLLAELEIPYNDEKAFKLAEKLSWFISFFSWSESVNLAKQRGHFIKFKPDEIDMSPLYKVFNSPHSPRKFKEEEVIKIRNVAVTSIAPTGSIALLAGVNSSIEPFYAIVYKRNLMSGIEDASKESLVEVNSILFRKLSELESDSGKNWTDSFPISLKGTIFDADNIPEKLRKVFLTAHEIDWKDHIRAQAAWQKYVTSSVSKTINMKYSVTVKDVEKAFMEMWKAGLKGGTIYRDGSKSFQVLSVGR